MIAAKCSELFELALRFDALSDDGQVQSVCQRNGRTHDGRIVVVGAEAIDEAAIHLQEADREALEIGERRETGAKVVQADANAEVAQFL